MSLKSFSLSLIAGLTLAGAALADHAGEIMVHDAYARASNTKAGAAFMQIMNHGHHADRLIAAKSDVAARTELHTHKEVEGVMKMLHVEEGFVIPAGETLELQRGGKHVMFMGLTAPFEQGAEIPVTLVFEKAGEVLVTVPVDLERKPAHGGQDHAGHDHSGHDHSGHDHSGHDHSGHDHSNHSDH